MDILNNLFWLFLLLSFLSPLVQRQMLELATQKGDEGYDKNPFRCCTC